MHSWQWRCLLCGITIMLRNVSMSMYMVASWHVFPLFFLKSSVFFLGRMNQHISQIAISESEPAKPADPLFDFLINAIFLEEEYPAIVLLISINVDPSGFKRIE